MIDHMDDIYAVQAKLKTLADIFRPAAPTDTLELFRGRISQLQSIQTGIAGKGEHLVVYGERGVGKTSIAYVAQALFDRTMGEVGLSVRVQCTDGGSYTSVWKEFFERLLLAVAKRSTEFRDKLSGAMKVADDIIPLSSEDLTATDINRVLTAISAECELLVVLDEFDRLGGWQETKPFGDLIKGLSDDRLPVTLMVVGVADNIDGLIMSHQSTSRNLRQVAMPRMDEDELIAIAEKGVATYAEKTGEDFRIEPKAARMVAQIAQGFPYYVHLIVGAAAAETIKLGKPEITAESLIDSMVMAVEEADHDLRSAYASATAGRADSSFDMTLFACARAEVDDLGYFSSRGVADALTKLTGVQKGPGNVNNHLKRLSAPPYWILETKRISARKPRYRFINPLMNPFIIVKGFQAKVFGQDN